MPITLPPEVTATVRTVFGERGEHWLADLPRMVADRCRAWGLEVIGESFEGGTHSFAAPVRREDGTLAVLKIPVVDEEDLGEVAALHWYDGDGAVRLFEYDPGSGAMLLEWAVPGTPLVPQPEIPLEGLPEHRDRVRLACALYRRLRRTPGELPEGFPALPLVADIVSGWAHRLADAPPVTYLDDALLGRARDWCAALAEPDGPLLIVNRDTHLGNIVAAEREPWLLIDPKGYLGEAAFDAGFLIMKQVETDPDPALVPRLLAATADALEVDRGRARGWALMRAVEEIIWSVDDGRPADAARYRQVAGALSGANECH
ncbi:aminoglycoside phosphotransferase family protein [Nocardia sp. NPDC024068]|uniref:aminoglycoside phosphotransferase family protein n=1 Tax=Nocardia sp. NPDC024068 TaxID=3157197 RepID=UPI0033E2935F